MVKILLVLGDQKDINPKIEENDILVTRSLGFKRHLIDITVISDPSPDDFQRKFESKSFNILIIVGHTNRNDDGRDGTITINSGRDRNANSIPSCISMNQYQGVFRDRVRKGLKLVILAGCCSDGAARKLTTELGVPKVIAFRRPISASVVRVFFERLFSSWIRDSLNLQLAMGRTREHLQATDPECPGGSATPILLTSVYAEQDLPLMFSDLLSIPILAAKTLGIGAIGIGAIGIFGILMPTSSISQTLCSLAGVICPTTACGVSDLKDKAYISCGDKDLFYKAKPNERSEEIHFYPKETIEKIKKEATTKNNEFSESWKKYIESNRPDLAIALSNEANKLSNKKVVTIAVMLPLSQDMLSRVKDLPQGLLGAVAQAQKQWNDNSHRSWNLEVMMVNDYNGESGKYKVEDIVNYVADINPKILGVISNYSSDVTEKAIEIYNNKKLLAVSGTVTATDFTRLDTTTDNNNKKELFYFIRTTGTTDDQADKILDYIKKHENIKEIKVLSGQGTFAKSFTNSLVAKSKLPNGKYIEIKPTDIMNISDFSSKIDLADDFAKEISIKKGRTALIIAMNPFNDGKANPAGGIISRVTRECHECTLIGSETMVDKSLWNFIESKSKKKQDTFRNMVFSLPYIYNDTFNKKYSRKDDERNLNQTLINTPISHISHRIYLTYDATNLLIDAISEGFRQGLNDEKIRQELPKLIKDITNPPRKHLGLTGQITFNGSDRNEAKDFYGLVKPQLNNGKFVEFIKAE